MTQLCQEFSVTSSQVSEWKAILLEHGAKLFQEPITVANSNESLKALHTTINKLKDENDYLSALVGR